MNYETSPRPPFARLLARGNIVMRALAAARRRREQSIEPQRVLIAHHLLLGDTLMLTPLLKKVRTRYPEADIVMTVPRAFASLYDTRPYGVRTLPWDPRRAAAGLFAEEAFDLALIPGDNRYAWLAAAMRAHWIVAFAGDRPARKSWAVDALVPYPDAPAAWGDIVATMVDGPPPPRFSTTDWAAPPSQPFALPTAPYAVLHVGASTPLKQWPARRWLDLAHWLAERGLTPVWSCGLGEEDAVLACDPQSRFASLAGKLDLPQLWQLLAHSQLVVAPDTGVAHLGRITGAPTVALFGPGSATICGAGDFWRDSPYRAVTVDPFPCRDQKVLFKREIAWVQRCARSVGQCPAHRCMAAIAPDAVHRAIQELGVLETPVQPAPPKKAVA
jgi:ADP-heptose:LPS heptosyltransferase